MMTSAMSVEVRRIDIESTMAVGYRDGRKMERKMADNGGRRRLWERKRGVLAGWKDDNDGGDR
jgi:hypothetical protein